MTSEKPLLPSLASILFTNKSKNIISSPSLKHMKDNFTSDDTGIIRLPPLSTGITRPRSVDSALRHTASLPDVISSSRDQQFVSVDRSHSSFSTTSKTPLKAELHQNSFETPSTPIVNKKHQIHEKITHKRNDMLTPLSAAKAIITPSNCETKRAFAFITHSQETFPTKEPKIDNAPLARRKRRRTSTHELNILQEEFIKCSAPDKHKRLELADICKMSEKAVQIWFQNKRQAVKRQRLAAEKVANVDTASHVIPKQISIEDTPTSNKILQTTTGNHSTPQLQIPFVEHQMTPLRTQAIDQIVSSPTKRATTPTQKRGQALTFHLKTDKKVLTSVKTSPNSRVNKLINSTGSPTENQLISVAATPSKKSKFQLKDTAKVPLKEINPNTLRR